MSGSILERQVDPKFTTPKTILVAGATGGIGHALCADFSQRHPQATIIRLARQTHLLKALPNCIDLSFDILEEASIVTALDQIPAGQVVDCAMLATGWLHDEKHSPEKSYTSLNSEHLIHAYRVNAVGPALLIKHLIPFMSRSNVSRIGVLSARVGSISDNRLGGWHAYRSSKAALNMLLKNYAIEMGYKRRQLILVGLQPGTTETPLSAPFKRNVPKDQLQSPEYTACHLIDVMQRLELADSGKLYDFLGLPFEP